MPYINGIYRNPDRTRKYGLDVGDRVKRTVRTGSKGTKIRYGNVVSLNGDNNRCQVLWDGDKEAGDEVAEWCCLINENGLELNNIYWRIMQNFQHGKMSLMRMKYILENELNISEEEMFIAFKTRPHIILQKNDDYWTYQVN